MNRIITLLQALLITLCTYGQQYGKYSLPHTTDNNILKQYIGKKIKVLHQDSDDKTAWNDSWAFEQMGRLLEKEYTIENIKATKKEIKIDLRDDKGIKSKIEVNAQGNASFQMNSCDSFFLVDDFKNDNKEIIGNPVKDINGNIIAKVVDIDMYGKLDDKPQILYTIERIEDDKLFLCSPEIIESILGKIGTNLSNPKVKHSYQIKNIEAEIPNPNNLIYGDKNYYKTYGGTFLSKDKEAIPEICDVKTKYTLVNCDTGELSSCDVTNPYTSAFEDDLNGHYVSVLNSVEKPTNPEIRHGETSIITDGDLTKFSYVDNFIDIIILGTERKFSFILKNVSDNSIKIIWDEAVFVDFDGSSSKIMHNGIKYSQREATQSATTIIKGAKIEDTIIANNKVYFCDNPLVNDWLTRSMYPSEKGLEPGQLKIMLPIQIKDIVNEYIFIFDVKYIYDHPERISDFVNNQ